jgi:phosphatidylinositol glycan class B
MEKPNFYFITVVALFVRILLALSTRTFFQPDEYFQSLEPAHHLVFGYGDLTWEWLNPKPIRSILFPGISAVVYGMLNALGLLKEGGKLADLALIMGPKFVHGSIAALTDIGLCGMTQKVLGDQYVYVSVRHLSRIVQCQRVSKIISL